MSATPPASRPPRRAVTAGLLGLGGYALTALAGCSSSPAPTATTSSSGRASSSTTTPAPSRTSASPTSSASPYRKLTGGPVLAAKIDNTSASRPRTGVALADVVYVEPVEAGLTRLLCVWSSRMPAEIGPVRSGRETDVDLLANYGKVAFAFSGGSAATVAALQQGSQVNLSNDASGVGFYRAGNRRAPYNVIGRTSALLARAGGSVPPGDPGFRYGPAPTGGAPATDVSTAWQASRISLQYDAARKQWRVVIDGVPDVDADGTPHYAGTVVVQHVPVRESANVDVNGVHTPLATVIGSGQAEVLREGKVWRGTWSRPSAGAPTNLMVGSQVMSLANGPVWVLLVPQGQAVRIAA